MKQMSDSNRGVAAVWQYIKLINVVDECVLFDYIQFSAFSHMEGCFQFVFALFLHESCACPLPLWSGILTRSVDTFRGYLPLVIKKFPRKEANSIIQNINYNRSWELCIHPKWILKTWNINKKLPVWPAWMQSHGTYCLATRPTVDPLGLSRCKIHIVYPHTVN